MLEKAKQQAMRYLVTRMRSEQEVRLYLEKKAYEPEIIDEVIEFLYHYDYLDDLKFCEAWINDRIQLKPCGRHKLIYELHEKGVSNLTIDQAIEEIFSYETELSLACNLVEKKRNQQVDELKLKNYLSYRGFSYDLIADALEKSGE